MRIDYYYICNLVKSILHFYILENVNFLYIFLYGFKTVKKRKLLKYKIIYGKFIKNPLFTKIITLLLSKTNSHYLFSYYNIFYTL